MKKEITRLICAAICCTPIIGFAQTSDKFTSADNLYKEGKELFQPGTMMWLLYYIYRKTDMQVMW